jgi:hypothetical protein
MKSDVRWIIAMWFLDWALSIAPNDDAKKSLLLAIAPWVAKEKAAAAWLLVKLKAGEK